MNGVLKPWLPALFAATVMAHLVLVIYPVFRIVLFGGMVVDGNVSWMT